MLRDRGAQKIVLRGFAYVPLFYAIVQAEQALVGKPLVWFGELHFFIAIFMPLVFTIGLLIQYRRSHERVRR
jgi:hypothetical protein